MLETLEYLNNTTKFLKSKIPYASKQQKEVQYVKGFTKIKRLISEYWTSAQRQSNSLHEVSYRACFKAELPRFFLSNFTKPDDVIYDPFMGRGTTLLEAALMGRKIIGNDISPLSRILIEPRIDPPRIEDIESRLKNICWSSKRRAEIDLSMFYSLRTERQIVALRNYLHTNIKNKEEDNIDNWIRMVATNRLTGHSPGFFSVYTLPPNQAVSPESQIKINLKRSQVPPDRDVPSIILKKSKSLLKDVTEKDLMMLRKAKKAAKYFSQDARQKLPIKGNTVDLVITSPPFLDTVQYAQDNWLRCWFNNIDSDLVSGQITMAKTVSEWANVMKDVFFELKRLLKPKGRIAFEVGEIRNGSILLDEVVIPIGLKVGLSCEGILVNQQKFTKTANCWGINNNSKGTNTNRIVIFKN